jgi:hypothetical protein
VMGYSLRVGLGEADADVVGVRESLGHLATIRSRGSRAAVEVI